MELWEGDQTTLFTIVLLLLSKGFASQSDGPDLISSRGAASNIQRNIITVPSPSAQH